MSRAIVAVMAGLLCALAGLKHASALKGDAARQSRWVQVLSHLALLLREGTLSIPEALCTAADGSLAPDELLRAMAARMSASPMTGLGEAFLASCGDCAEKDVLTRLFARVGRGSKESRVLAAEQGAEEMRLMAASASAKAEKDAKLWQTLGFTGGICLTILLL